MVQTRVTEKMKTYGKGCPRKSKAQKKRGPVIFLDIHKVPDCYTLQAALVNYHHPLFVSNELLRSLLHPYFWSYVLNVCADLCLKSSLVNSKLRLMKSRWMVLPRGFQLYSSSVGHLTKAFWLACRGTQVRIAGLGQALHHGWKEIQSSRNEKWVLPTLYR